MAETREDEIRQLVERVYRAESSRILATLIRLLGDFDLAEDAMQDAFAAALVRWSRDGAPENPRAWLVSTSRFEAIDSLRRRARFDASLERIAEQLETQTSGVTVIWGIILRDFLPSKLCGRRLRRGADSNAPSSGIRIRAPGKA
jgi:DNA-directed RNA polymerase specialized sigma24 family protein